MFKPWSIPWSRSQELEALSAKAIATAPGPIPPEIGNTAVYNVSYSEVNAIGACERQWYYSYVLKLQTVKPYSDPLAHGIYGHQWLQVYYTRIKAGDSKYDATTAGNNHISQLMVKGEITAVFGAKLCSLMSKYVKFYHDEDDADYRILAVEHTFSAPITDEYSLAGQIDVVKYGVRGRYLGQIIVEDHKFTNNFWKPITVMMASQIPKYIWMLNNSPEMKDALKGKEVTLGYFNEIRYRAMAEHNTFFKRTPVEPGIIRINEIMKDHKKFAERIADLHTLEPEQVESEVARTQHKRVCDECDFVMACDASLESRVDEARILAIGFKPNTYGYNF